MDQNRIEKLLDNSLPWSDRLAIGFSLVCIIHCLVLPLLLVAVPALGASFFADEQFHFWLVFAVIPTSLYSLSLGCRRHHRNMVLVLGLIGIGLLLVGLAAEDLSLGEWGERSFTVLGALFVAAAHIRNFQLCRSSDADDCHPELEA
ncbi:MAG: MerC domain-containing protein [Pseudomonadota bacterium]